MSKTVTLEEGVPNVPSRVGDASLVAGRRRAIVRATTKLMLRQGYHETTVREIARAADLTMGSLYLYISRKEDVLYLISQTIMDELYGSLKKLEHKPTALETLQSATERFFKAVHRMRGEIRLLYRESASMMPEHLEDTKRRELEGRAVFASIIREGIGRGEFRSVDPEIVAHNIIVLGHMWSLKAWALRDKCDLAKYYHTQLEMIVGCIQVDGPMGHEAASGPSVR